MAIDFYDDLGEAFLRHLGEGDPPEILKTASWKEPFDLLDRDFALILIDGEGKEHRKFACHDPGNILMSMWYLNEARDLLSPAASKVASINLAAAAGHFGMEVPQEIFDLNVDVDPNWSRDIIDEKRVKVAMAPGQPMMPGAGGKSAANSMIGGRPSGVPPMVTKSTPRLGSMGPGGMAPRGAKTASFDSPFDVLAYAELNWGDMDPYDRHDVAVYLCKEGAACGVQVPDHIYKYGGTGVNPRFEALMTARKQYVRDEETCEKYDLLGKMASLMEPLEVVEALFLLDEQSSLTPRYGLNIPDPLLCVFHHEKEAEYSWIEGTDMVTEKMLDAYATAPHCYETMGDLFTEDICERFKKSPLETFKGMPDEQKTILARLAAQNGYTNNGGFFR